MSRRSARLVLQNPALHVLSPLLPELVRAIFLALPVDARLRAREVCRGWRAFLNDATLWQICDLSDSSGVVARRTHALLLAACAPARGTLRVLDATGWLDLIYQVGEGTLGGGAYPHC
jgi:hypothetical protein